MRAESTAAETKASHGNTESRVLLSHAHRPRGRGAEPVQGTRGCSGSRCHPAAGRRTAGLKQREARPGDLKGNSGASRGDRIETEIWARKRTGLALRVVMCQEGAHRPCSVTSQCGGRRLRREPEMCHPKKAILPGHLPRLRTSGPQFRPPSLSCRQMPESKTARTYHPRRYSQHEFMLEST